MPTWYVFPAGCASAASGPARRPPAKPPMNVRRSITRSPDPPVQERRRNRQAEGRGGLEVDDQLELRGLLDGKIGWFRAPQDLVHVHGRTAEQVEVIGTVADARSGLGVPAHWGHRRQPVH